MWCNIRELKQILKCSSQYVYALRKQGKLEAKKISDRKFLYKLPESLENSKSVALYVRVSTPKQKQDLQNQIEALKLFVLGQGKPLNEKFIFSDIASGMNENRKGLQKLLEAVKEEKISEIFISHKDRLTRFGYGYLESICNMFGTKITPIDYTEEKTFQEELTEDLVAIIHHFSMKFYGKRKNLVKKLATDINSIKEIN